MRQRDQKRRSTTYHKWLLSYVLLMIIPLLFGCVIYGYALNRIQEDVEYVQRQTLTQVRDAVEGNLYMCDHIGLALTNKTEAESLSHFEEGHGYSVRQRIYPKELLEDMLLYSASNEMIDEVMLYFPKTDYILRRGRFCLLDYSEKIAESDYKMGLEQFRMFSRRGMTGLHALENGENGLLYVYSVYGQRENTADITVFIYLNTSVIRDMVQLAQSSVFLSMADGSWFSPSGEALPAGWEQVLVEQGEYTLFSGADSYIMKLRSEEYQLEFLNVIEKRLYLEGINQMKQILILYVIVSSVAGIGIACYVSRRNYQPVKELLELTGGALQEMEDGNDFSVIRAAYQRLLSDYQDNAAKLRESRAGERNSWMNELLKGRSSNVTAAIKGFDIWAGDMQYESFALLSVDLVDMGNMQEEEAEEISTEVMDMSYFIVQNILGEMLSERYEIVEAETDGKLFALVNINDQFDQKKVLNDLKITGHKTCDFIRMNFGIKLMINISEVHEGRRHIRDCYKDIQEMLEYREFEGLPEEMILTKADCRQDEERELRFDCLKYYLKREEYGRVQELVAELQRKKALEENTNTSLEQTDDLEKYVRNEERIEQTALQTEARKEEKDEREKAKATKQIKETQKSLEKEQQSLGKEQQSNVKISSEENQEQQKVRTENTVGEASGIEEADEAEKQLSDEIVAERQIDRLMDEIAAYIEVHFTEGLLSAGVLADEFDIGLSYMSRSFKKRKGIGILDYINRLRLERAKELIAEGVTVRETAEQVGYYTTQPLIRVFRQIEGMTPSEYRNSLSRPEKKEKH